MSRSENLIRLGAATVTAFGLGYLGSAENNSSRAQDININPTSTLDVNVLVAQNATMIAQNSTLIALSQNQEAPQAVSTPAAPLQVVIGPLPIEEENNTTHPDTNWKGELPFNNFAGENGETDKIMEPISAQLKEDYQAVFEDHQDPKEVFRINSLSSSLFNKLAKGTSAYPEVEAGLNQTDTDVDKYESITDLMDDKDVMTVDEMVHTNEKGVKTFGVYGKMNDIDAITAWIATGAVEVLGRTNNGTDTIENAWKNQDTLTKIAQMQREIYAQTRRNSLGVSDAEQLRRSTNDPDDASVSLPDQLKGDTQIDTCQVKRVPATGPRLGQLQQEELVVHRQLRDGESEESSLMNAEDEIVLFVFAYDSNTQVWDVDGFTMGKYNGPVEGQINSAVGEEMRNCYVAQIITPTATVTLPNPATSVPVNPTDVPHNECDKDCDHHDNECEHDCDQVEKSGPPQHNPNANPNTEGQPGGGSNTTEDNDKVSDDLGSDY
jgi:hypothetical protein